MSTYTAAILCMIILAPTVSAAFGATTFFAEGKFTENGIEWCGEESARYQTYGEAKWLELNKQSIEARICANLYSDPLWQYHGADRVQKLIQRSAYYAKLEISESQQESVEGKIDTSPVNSQTKIPSWVRNIFIWYGQGKLSDDEVINAIKYLVEKDIIKLKTG